MTYILDEKVGSKVAATHVCRAVVVDCRLSKTVRYLKSKSPIIIDNNQRNNNNIIIIIR